LPRLRIVASQRLAIDQGFSGDYKKRLKNFNLFNQCEAATSAIQLNAPASKMNRAIDEPSKKINRPTMSFGAGCHQG